MAYKNILCAYSGKANRGSALRHAIALAKKHDAWLTAVLRHGRPALERRLTGQLPMAMLKQLRSFDQELIQEVTQRFETITKEEGMSERAEFVDLDYEADGPIATFARHFDIVVTGVHSYDSFEEHMSAHPDMIALRSGRPVLIVPDGFPAGEPAAHAMVAWDGKRSSARALADAMPILMQKSEITVLTVGTEPPALKDLLLRNLERQGIKAQFLLEPSKKSTAHTILTTAERISARLIVMGAFEHSKFTQMVLGGVTTDVIRDTRIPVFMSH